VSARSLENRRTPSASLAIDNLRAVVILLVLAFHSVLAYLNFLPTTPIRSIFLPTSGGQSR
jgi:hypothetical protein